MTGRWWGGNNESPAKAYEESVNRLGTSDESQCRWFIPAPEFDSVIGRDYRPMNRFRTLNDVFAHTPRNICCTAPSEAMGQQVHALLLKKELEKRIADLGRNRLVAGNP